MYTGTHADDDDDFFTMSQYSFNVSRPDALSGLHVLSVDWFLLCKIQRKAADKLFSDLTPLL